MLTISLTLTLIALIIAIIALIAITIIFRWGGLTGKNPNLQSMATIFREAIVWLPLKHRRADLSTINDKLQRVNVRTSVYCSTVFEAMCY